MSEKRIKAAVTTEGLVISFPDAENPKIWRANMKTLETASFELTAQEDKTALVLSTVDKKEQIHTFADKEDALLALQTVSTALFKGAPLGAGVPAHLIAGGHGGGFFGKFFKFLFMLIIMFVVLILFFGLRLRNATPPMDAAPAEIGIPMSADDMFKE